MQIEEPEVSATGSLSIARLVEMVFPLHFFYHAGMFFIAGIFIIINADQK